MEARDMAPRCFDWQAAEHQSEQFEALATRALKAQAKLDTNAPQVERLRSIVLQQQHHHTLQMLSAALKATQAFCEHEHVGTPELIQSVKVDQRHRLQALYSACGEASAQAISLRDHVASWLDTCTLADMDRDLAVLVTKSLKATNMGDRGLVALRAHELLEEKPSVLRSENASELKKRVAARREFVELLERLFQLSNVTMSQAIATYLSRHPETGNRYHQLPPKLRAELRDEAGTARETTEPPTEPVGSVRHFQLHVTKGFNGRPSSGVKMQTTLKDIKTRTEQRGDTKVFITTYYYKISYVPF
jgi:hypothetical protein